MLRPRLLSVHGRFLRLGLPLVRSPRRRRRLSSVGRRHQPQRPPRARLQPRPPRPLGWCRPPRPPEEQSRAPPARARPHGSFRVRAHRRATLPKRLRLLLPGSYPLLWQSRGLSRALRLRRVHHGRALRLLPRSALAKQTRKRRTQRGSSPTRSPGSRAPSAMTRRGRLSPRLGSDAPSRLSVCALS
jgi:hypothetical protein